MIEVPEELREIISTQPAASWGPDVLEGIIKWLYSKECLEQILGRARSWLAESGIDFEAAWQDYVLKQLLRLNLPAPAHAADPKTVPNTPLPLPAELIPPPIRDGESAWIEQELPAWLPARQNPASGIQQSHPEPHSAAQGHLMRFDPGRGMPLFSYIVSAKGRNWDSFQGYCWELIRRHKKRAGLRETLPIIPDDDAPPETQPVGVPADRLADANAQDPFRKVEMGEGAEQAAQLVREMMPVLQAAFDKLRVDAKRRLLAGGRVMRILDSFGTKVAVKAARLFYSAWSTYLLKVQNDARATEGALRKLRCDRNKDLRKALIEAGFFVEDELIDDFLWRIVHEQENSN